MRLPTKGPYLAEQMAQKMNVEALVVTQPVTRS
jgi:hypothetical protein